MTRLKLFLFIFFMLFTLSCALKEQPKIACHENLQKPKPLWIDGDRDLKNYYTGLGFAGENDIKKAKNTAMQDLAQNITSQINSSFHISSNYNISKNREDYKKNARSFLKIESRVTLNDLKQDAKWVDPFTCAVWIRLKIEKSAVDNLIKLNKAKKLYLDADSSAISLALRSDNISKAIKIISNIDFSALPKNIEDKDYYLFYYNELKQKLNDRIKARRIMYALIYNLTSKDSISKETAHYILLKIMKNNEKGWYEEDIKGKTLEEYMQKALNSKSEKLVLINIDKSLKEGFLYEAILNIYVSVYDVKTGALLSKPVQAYANIFASHKSKIDWVKIADKIFEKNPFKKIVKN
jgi:hypothetical protein